MPYITTIVSDKKPSDELLEKLQLEGSIVNQFYYPVEGNTTQPTVEMLKFKLKELKQEELLAILQNTPPPHAVIIDCRKDRAGWDFVGVYINNDEVIAFYMTSAKSNTVGVRKYELNAFKTSYRKSKGKTAYACLSNLWHTHRIDGNLTLKDAEKLLGFKIDF